MLLKVSNNYIINTNAIIAVRSKDTGAEMKVTIGLMSDAAVELTCSYEHYNKIINMLGVEVA